METSKYIGNFIDFLSGTCHDKYFSNVESINHQNIRDLALEHFANHIDYDVHIGDKESALIRFMMLCFADSILESYDKLQPIHINYGSYVESLKKTTERDEEQHFLQHRISNVFQSGIGLVTIQGFLLGEEDVVEKSVLRSLNSGFMKLIEAHAELF